MIKCAIQHCTHRLVIHVRVLTAAVVQCRAQHYDDRQRLIGMTRRSGSCPKTPAAGGHLHLQVCAPLAGPIGASSSADAGASQPRIPSKRGSCPAPRLLVSGTVPIVNPSRFTPSADTVRPSLTRHVQNRGRHCGHAGVITTVASQQLCIVLRDDHKRPSITPISAKSSMSSKYENTLQV